MKSRIMQFLLGLDARWSYVNKLVAICLDVAWFFRDRLGYRENDFSCVYVNTRIGDVGGYMPYKEMTND